MLSQPTGDPICPRCGMFTSIGCMCVGTPEFYKDSKNWALDETTLKKPVINQEDLDDMIKKQASILHGMLHATPECGDMCSDCYREAYKVLEFLKSLKGK